MSIGTQRLYGVEYEIDNDTEVSRTSTHLCRVLFDVECIWIRFSIVQANIM